MKRIALISFALVALAGCGGGEDSDDASNEPAAQTSADVPAEEAPAGIDGKPTPEKVAAALQLTKQGSGYESDSKCVIREVVLGGKQVAAAEKKDPGATVANDADTIGVVLDSGSERCVYEMALRLSALN
jgi:hypothetical protein